MLYITIGDRVFEIEYNVCSFLIGEILRDFEGPDRVSQSLSQKKVEKNGYGKPTDGIPMPLVVRPCAICHW